jgi:hypothetical protein
MTQRFEASAQRGEDLLALGVERLMAHARYSAAPGGYARIVSACRVGSALGRPAVCVDIESLGFIGRPLFLIGALFLDGAGSAGTAAAEASEQGRPAPGRLVQYLARDYSEEESVLQAFLGEAAAASTWITFNGRTFDLPFLALRAAYHRLPAPSPQRHVDLLPVARRLWGSRLPDCRLQTLERRVCRRPPRRDDLGGAAIPAAYHAYVRTGEPWEMLRILQHNADDLISLGELLRAAREAGFRPAKDGD